MDLQLVITILALLGAAVFGGLSWRLARQERERSEARVTALSDAIEAEDTSADAHVAQGRTPVAANSSPLFAPTPAGSGRGMPVLALSVALSLFIALIIGVALANRGSAVQDAARPAAPLELLSMRHNREGTTLTVSGLVRNPPAGSSVERVIVVVFAFDRTGSFVGSGRAPLDFVTLEPGDESPFVVTIPGLDEVGRYRVSFRTERGVVRHLDRRAGQTRLNASAHAP